MDLIHQQYYESLLNTTDKKYYNTVSKLFNSHYKKNQYINTNVYHDLEIFNGYQDNLQYNLWNILDNTHTFLGKYKLQQIISQPTNNKAILIERQNRIKSLEINYSILIELFQKLKNNETYLLDLWDPNILKDTDYSHLYFTNEKLKFINKNPILIGFYTYYRIFIVPVMGVLTPIIGIIVPFIILKIFYKFPISFKQYYSLMKFTFTGYGNLLGNNRTIEILKGIGYMLWILSYTQNTYNNYEIASKTYTLTEKIHLKLNNISKFFTISEQILSYTNYKTTIPIPELMDPIFNKQPKIINHKGKILSTYYILINSKQLLIDFIYNLSVIDSYLSILTLNKKYDFTFSHYLDINKPFIYCNDIYHPILLENNKEIVKNNIRIGIHSKPNNLIITGPNAGGKSTFIKSLVLSVLLSQTFTITPCSFFCSSPFTIINTYLNIPDNKGKESLFEVEMRRSLEHINAVKRLPKNEFSFIIMDEILSSTNPEEAVAGAYGIADILSQYDNSITIITTHFKNLTKIERKNSKFINYQFPIIRNKCGNIFFKYKLKNGVSQQFIALELLKKEGFDNELISKSLKIQQKILKYPN